MATQIIRVDADHPPCEAMDRAGEVLRRGGLVAFPTETVYGVGARADDSAAVAQLREIKSRDDEKGFTVHIPSPEDLADFGPELTGMAGRFVRKGWPGPLTLILPVADPSSAAIMAGRNGSAARAMYYNNSVGLRCPEDRVAHEILSRVGAPVVAASANRAGQSPPRTADDVLRELDDKIDLLVDAGPTKYAKPSTIVRVTGESYELLREGVYDRGVIERLAVSRLLFVCTGNTCRSPMAVVLAEKLIAQRLGCAVEELSGHGVIVESAGTMGGRGAVSPEAVAVMARLGLDLSRHVSTGLSAEMVQQADHIFAMTRSHSTAIRALAPSAAGRVLLLLDDGDVADPIGGSEEEYERCAQRIEEALGSRLLELSL